MKIVRYGVNALAVVVIGFVLSRFASHLPYEFPPLPALIAFVMRRLGIDTVTNADDIETIGLLLIIALSLVVAAVIVWLANVSFRRWRVARRS
jgi:glucose uptake protein GlcU